MIAQKNAEVFLIDASIYIFKYYFSMPDHWWSENDFSTAAVYGYTHWLFRFLKATRTQNVAACFDESLESCFRNQLYPAYKSSRALPDESLAFQLNACKQITGLVGIPCYASQAYEADDLLGTLAQRCREQGLHVRLLTRDKDLAQLLVTANDCLWDFPDGEKLFAKNVKQKLGVPPTLVADFLALVGDPGDDIPGVPGVGPKTAAALLQALGPWQSIKRDYNKIASLPLRGARNLAHKLREHAEQIDLALKLAQIVCKAPLGRRFSVARKKINATRLVDFGAELGFGSRFASSVEKLIHELQ